MTAVVDYSFARPAPSVIKAGGYIGAVRYLAPVNTATKPKILTASEATALHAVGLSIGLVWENGGQRALQGFNAGQADGRAAAAMAVALGAPGSTAIYAAVDFGATTAEMPAVVQYVRGFKAGLAGAFRCGVYGSYWVVRACAAVADLFWQTGAWSGTYMFSGACLFQQIGGATIPGTDVDQVRKTDWGQWDPPVTPAPHGASAPIPTVEDFVLTIFGADGDAGFAAQAAALRSNTHGTRFASEAKAATGTVLVIGSPACGLLGLPTAAGPHVTTSGKYVIANGSDAVASAFLAVSWLNGAGRAVT